MAYNWQRLHRLIDRFGKYMGYQRLVSATFDEKTGEELRTYDETQILASLQPVKKKGNIGGENELQLVYDEDGDWESGAFIIYTKNFEKIRVGDFLPHLVIDGEDFGQAYVDKIQNWSGGNGLYKGRVLLTSVAPSMESLGVQPEDY